MLCCEKKIFLSHVYTGKKELQRQQNIFKISSLMSRTFFNVSFKDILCSP